MNNRLTAEVREEKDAVGVNDLNAHLYICSYSFQSSLSFSPHLQVLNTDTHIVRHHRVCAGTMLEVNSLLPALDAPSHRCLGRSPANQTPYSTSEKDWKVSFQKAL